MASPGSKTLLRLGMTGLALFCVAFVVLHLLNWRDPPRHVSNYVHLAGGWFWDVGLAGLGAGTLLLVAGLRGTVTVRGPPAWGLRALEFAGCAILLMIAFPTDRNLHAAFASTPAGYVHDTFAVMSTFLICWSMLLLIAAARVDAAWGGVPGRSWLWPLATISCALIWMGGDVTQFWQIAAVVQRGVVVLMVAWLLTLGWRALSAAQALASGMPQPVPPPQPMR